MDIRFGGYSVRIDDSTQSATVYDSESNPVGTIMRRRVLDHHSPVFSAYDKAGKRVATAAYRRTALIRFVNSLRKGVQP